MKDPWEKVVETAMSWWVGKRPVDWTLGAHIRNPTINTVTEREKKLAKACGFVAYIRRQRAQDRRDEKKIYKKKLIIKGLHV